MLDIMIKANYVTWPCFKSNGWYLFPTNSPQFLTFTSFLGKRIGIVIAGEVTAWNYTEATGITSQRIKVESDLDMQYFLVPSVGMPSSITNIVITVAAHVIEIISK